MTQRLFICAVGVAIGAVIGLAPAHATEGYFSHGYGAVNKSMAGAGVATGFDAMSQVTNPAALTLVDPQFTVDLSVFSPWRSYTVTGTPSGLPAFGLTPGSFDSDRNYFFIPSLAGAYSIDDASNWGWAIYGNGGMNTTWTDAPGPFFGGKSGVDLAQMFIQGTYARQITPAVSIGIGPIFAVQRFEALGLAQFGAFGFSSDDTKLTNNGYDYSYGYGGRFGVQVQLPASVRLGASYQSRMYMTKFDKYKGLFAEQGGFDIPPALQLGLTWGLAPGLSLSGDWKRIWYSQVDSVGNPFASPGLLGDNNGPGFGWEDIDAFKFGLAWDVNQTVTLRAGVGLNDNPIPASEVLFNILAPGVQEQHYTAGLSWKLSPNSTINFAAMYSPSNSVTGVNPLDPAQTIEIEMYQWEATIGWTWTF